MDGKKDYAKEVILFMSRIQAPSGTHTFCNIIVIAS